MTTDDFTLSATHGAQSRGKADKNVRRVDIDSEHAVYLPNGFGQLFKNLQEFFVWFSKLKYVERENFKDMNKLLRLDLAYNQVEDIPEDTFWDLTSLEGLWLQENKIKILQQNVFQTLENLKFFAAESNEIEELHPDLFHNNFRLEKIFLSGNKIKSIGVDFGKFPAINALDFTMNVCIDKEFNAQSTWCSDIHCVSKNELNEAIKENC